MKCPHCKEEIKEVRQDVNFLYYHYYKIGKNGKVDEKKREEIEKDAWGFEVYCGHCGRELDYEISKNLWD